MVKFRVSQQANFLLLPKLYDEKEIILDSPLHSITLTLW